MCAPVQVLAFLQLALVIGFVWTTDPMPIERQSQVEAATVVGGVGCYRESPVYCYNPSYKTCENQEASGATCPDGWYKQHELINHVATAVEPPWGSNYYELDVLWCWEKYTCYSQLIGTKYFCYKDTTLLYQSPEIMEQFLGNDTCDPS